MSKHSFLPLELLPEWLIESPITFDDLRCTSPPSTIFRMSLPPSPVKYRKGSFIRGGDSVLSLASGSSGSDIDSDTELNAHADPSLPIAGRDHVNAAQEQHGGHTNAREPETQKALAESRSFLWDADAEEDDAEHADDEGGDEDDDDATLHEHNHFLDSERERPYFDTSPIDPFFVPPKPSSQPQPEPQSRSRTHSRPSSASEYGSSPWFMHIDPAALAPLDDQLLQSPTDAFADLCYAHAVELPDSAGGGATPGSYSWRRFSRLRPLSPFSEGEEDEKSDEEEEEEEESSSEADSDSDQLASPEQQRPSPGIGAGTHFGSPTARASPPPPPPRVYSPTPASHDPRPDRHARHYHQESDGSIRIGFGSGLQRETLSPTFAFGPSPPTKTKPPPPSLAAAEHHVENAEDDRDDGDVADMRRRATASPPPLFLPSPAVSQAQLALLFGSATAARAGESVHFFPATAHAHAGGDGKRKGGLRISTATGARGTWLRRIRAGFSG